MNPGFLLALEGIDGSGKSTAAEGIVSALRADGRTVLATREPSEGAWGRRIREMAASGQTVGPAEELRWFMEDRREHVAQVIAPALAAGNVVVTDRYFLSSVAYQGGRGLDWRRILDEAEAEFPLPDLALLFEIDPAAGLARTRDRGRRAEPAFEERRFLIRVAAIYEAVERPWLQRVPAQRGPEAVLADALGRVRAALAARA